MKLLPGLVRRAAKPAVDAGPRAVMGVTRAGKVGVGIYHQGRMTGWGASESAAWAAHQMATIGKSARIVVIPVDAVRKTRS